MESAENGSLQIPTPGLTRLVEAYEVHPGESSDVQAVVDWFGPTNFLKMDEQLEESGIDGPIEHDAPTSPESLLVGCQITECPDEAMEANPIAYVTPDDPPFMIMHGKQDSLVPYQQSRLLFDALRDACVEATYHRLENGGTASGTSTTTHQSTNSSARHSPASGTGPETGRRPGITPNEGRRQTRRQSNGSHDPSCGSRSSQLRRPVCRAVLPLAPAQLPFCRLIVKRNS